ncbi:zwittermicin A resistance protein ZmaR [Bacillus sp. UMTAT18]|nr:zwittermicin A resistance protein ZmaR [Bacillus sp. UMTAT18]
MFEDFNNVVLLSYLQGHMGTAWVNNLENPTVAQITALSERESPSPLGMG